MPSYSDIIRPLTYLSKKRVSDFLKWTLQCQQASVSEKQPVCGVSSLLNRLQTSPSDKGMGRHSVLGGDGKVHPLQYIIS